MHGEGEGACFGSHNRPRVDLDHSAFIAGSCHQMRSQLSPTQGEEAQKKSEKRRITRRTTGLIVPLLQRDNRPPNVSRNLEIPLLVLDTIYVSTFEIENALNWRRTMYFFSLASVH